MDYVHLLVESKSKYIVDEQFMHGRTTTNIKLGAVD